MNPRRSDFCHPQNWKKLSSPLFGGYSSIFIRIPYPEKNFKQKDPMAEYTVHGCLTLKSDPFGGQYYFSGAK